jgi:hypothetical protein
MTAFVVVNLMIAVICDAVGILREAEEALLHENEPVEESAAETSEDEQQKNLRTRIHEMEEMLDEIVSIQNQMVMMIDKAARSG